VKAMATNPGCAGKASIRASPCGSKGQSLADRPTLRGSHNRENAFAACLLARHLGAGLDALQKALDTYPGLPHRLEPVRVLDGWSGSTTQGHNVDSVEKSLSAFERNVHIIMGGRGKGAPYAPLRASMRGRVKTILTIGEDAATIASEWRAWRRSTPARSRDRGAAGARAGAVRDVVLLSSACGYDQFAQLEESSTTSPDRARSRARRTAVPRTEQASICATPSSSEAMVAASSPMVRMVFTRPASTRARAHRARLCPASHDDVDVALESAERLLHAVHVGGLESLIHSTPSSTRTGSRR